MMARAGRPANWREQPALVPSSRKFAGRRAIAIIYGWIWIHLAYWLGVSPDRLARFYYSSRRHRRRATGDLAGGRTHYLLPSHNPPPLSLLRDSGGPAPSDRARA